VQMHNLSDFKDLMAGIQDLVVSLAVLAGGIWSLFTFNALATRRRARAEVAEIERRLEQQAVLNITVSAQQTSTIGTTLGRQCLKIDVVMTNIGNRNVEIRLDPFPVWVTECIPFNATVIPLATYYLPYDIRNSADRETLGLVRTGASWHFSAIAWLRYPGLYEVRALAKLSQVEVDVSVRDGVEAGPGEMLLWEDSTFTVVQPIGTDGVPVSELPNVHQTLALLVSSVEASLIKTYQVFRDTEFTAEPDANMLAMHLGDIRFQLFYGTLGKPCDAEYAMTLSNWDASMIVQHSQEILAKVGYERIRSNIAALVSAFPRSSSSATGESGA